jgi:hypothetical protein
MTIEEKKWLTYDMNVTGIDDREKQEESLLYFTSDQILLWLKDHNAFHKFDKVKKLNTFSDIRKVLSQITNKIHERFDTLESFLDVITLCKTEIIRIASKKESKTETVILFENYLERLANKLRRIYKLPVKQLEDNDNWEELRLRVTNRALSKLSSTNDKDTLKSVAWLFFYELQSKNQTFNSDEICLTELMKEFNKEKFTDPNIIGFDDLKVFNKKKPEQD